MTASAFKTAAEAAIATRLSPATRQDYRRALGKWLKHCDEHRVDPVDPPGEAAASFRDVLAEALETSTVRGYLAAMSFVYRRLVAQRPAGATWNPFDGKALTWPPESKVGKTEPLELEVIERMIAAAEAEDTESGLRDAALLRLIASTGSRRMSIVTLRRDRLSRREGKLRARVKTKGSGGAELHWVEIPPRAAVALERWLAVMPKGRAYVFPSRSGDGHMDLSTVNRIVRRWGVAVGEKHVHPHRFRTSFITEAFDLGIPWRDVQASVDHSDPRSTQRYDRGQRGAGVADAVDKARSKKREES